MGELDDGKNSVISEAKHFRYKMIDYLGVVAIIFFYLLILIVGIWAGRKAKNVNSMIEGEQTEEVMLAGRNIGTIVGIFTMTGTFK
uniref:Uncharacterized protein n=1 Tax=Parascaris univalens TaxID=6257 RepID=A0A915B5T7_PARUN